MTRAEFNLNDGLAAYAQLQLPKDFTFIAGDHQYMCNTLAAIMLSPNVAQMISCDPMADTMELDIRDDNYEFKDLINLLEGVPITITTQNYHYLLEIGSLLGNTSLTDAVNSVSIENDISITTAIETALRKIADGVSPDVEYGYIAEHLYACTASTFENIPTSELCSIFFSPKLKVADESALFNLVLEILKSRGSSARILLQSIHFENLSVVDMMHYTEEMRASDFTGSVFHSMCRRITESTNSMRKISDDREFEYTKNHSFEGLFWNLRKQWKYSLLENQIIKITASDGSDPSRIITGEGDCWYSRNEQDSWVMFDFLDHAFELTHYSLRTFVGAPNSGHLKNWVFEGSNNGKDWSQIDRRIDDQSLNGRNKQRTYKCHGDKAFYRYIRLRQCGKNHCGNNFLFLRNIEFFGSLV